MKIKFKDGTIIETLDNENLSREDFVEEAKKIHKEFKDTAKTLTVQCYIFDDDKILIQDRVSNVWHGLAVPGGHLKSNETPEQGCIREVKEETGLDVSGLVLFGTNEYTDEEDGECMALLYKTSTFSGTLKGSDEGEVKWMKIRDVFDSNNCAEGFKSLLSKCCNNAKKDSKPISKNKMKDSVRYEGEYYPETRTDPAEYPYPVVESDYSGEEITDDYVYSIDGAETYGTLDEILEKHFTYVDPKNEELVKKAAKIMDCEEQDILDFIEIDGEHYISEANIENNSGEVYNTERVFTYQEIQDLFSYSLIYVIQRYNDEMDREPSYDEDYEDWNNERLLEKYDL